MSAYNPKYNCLRYFNHGSLKTWSQRRCCKCHRFLGRKQMKYCSKCTILRMRERDGIWNKIKHFTTQNSYRTIRELVGVKIPERYYRILVSYT